MQIANELRAESKKNQSRNIRVLRATNENVTKRLKNKQEKRLTVKVGQTAEAATKRIVSQGFQVENLKIKK